MSSPGLACRSGAGHPVVLERPEEVSRVIGRFLEWLDPRESAQHEGRGGQAERRT